MSLFKWFLIYFYFEYTFIAITILSIWIRVWMIPVLVGSLNFVLLTSMVALSIVFFPYNECQRAFNRG